MTIVHNIYHKVKIYVDLTKTDEQSLEIVPSWLNQEISQVKFIATGLKLSDLFRLLRQWTLTRDVVT